MHVNMIFAYYAFKYANIFCITYLYYQLSTSLLYLTSKNFISVFCYPHKMYRQSGHCVTGISILHSCTSLNISISEEGKYFLEKLKVLH